MSSNRKLTTLLIALLSWLPLLGCPLGAGLESVPGKMFEASQNASNLTDTANSDSDESTDEKGTEPPLAPEALNRFSDATASHSGIPDSVNRIAREYGPNAQPVNMPGGVFSPQPAVGDECQVEMAVSLTPLCREKQGLYRISLQGTAKGTKVIYPQWGQQMLVPCLPPWMQDWPWRVVVKDSQNSFFDFWMKKDSETSSAFSETFAAPLDSTVSFFALLEGRPESLMLLPTSHGSFVPYACPDEKCIDPLNTKEPDQIHVSPLPHIKVPDCSKVGR